ncbi:MAG TPA: NTP transferase domain-containing protein [Chitinophagaceae bacterium]
MKMEAAFSTVILAAGNSSRMNSPKPFLPFDDKRNFIEKIIDTYIAAGIHDIILIISGDIERRMKLMLSNSYPSQKIELVVNRYPERGRFYSIRLGLGNVKTSSCFLQNTDNPFITMPLVNEIMKADTDSAYVVPAFRDKEGHPVLVSNEIVKHLLLLEGEDHHLRNELKRFSKIKVNWPYENILANINTREEYMKYFLDFDLIYKKSA